MSENIPSVTQESAAPPRRSVPLWVQGLVWGLLLVLLAVVALGLRRRQEGHIQIGETLPEGLVLTTFEGYEYQGQGQVAFDDLRGKVILINFWASWCNPCRDEAAELENTWRYYQASGADVVFVGVDYVDVEPDARAYLQEFDITYPNGPDLGTRISQAFRIQGVPETYVFDRQGVLRYIKIGPFASEAEIRQVVDDLLGE